MRTGLNLRRLPFVSTVIVLAAVAVMIALGFWQLERREQKAQLLSRYAAAAANGREVAWPRNPDEAESALYRRSRLDCPAVTGMSAIAGQNRDGQPGLAITATCRTGDDGTALVVLGWSRDPQIPEWNGGEVSGVIAPGPRLVAAPPLAGLQANAMPDPSQLPDNHLSYAVQWFFFAATALSIYGLAVRARLRR